MRTRAICWAATDVGARASGSETSSVGLSISHIYRYLYRVSVQGIPCRRSSHRGSSWPWPCVVPSEGFRSSHHPRLLRIDQVPSGRSPCTPTSSPAGKAVAQVRAPRWRSTWTALSWLAYQRSVPRWAAGCPVPSPPTNRSWRLRPRSVHHSSQAEPRLRTANHPRFQCRGASKSPERPGALASTDQPFAGSPAPRFQDSGLLTKTSLDSGPSALESRRQLIRMPPDASMLPLRKLAPPAG
jgi:hypothetical protein